MRNFSVLLKPKAAGCSPPKNYNWMLIIIMLMVSMDNWTSSCLAWVGCLGGRWAGQSGYLASRDQATSGILRRHILIAAEIILRIRKKI